jgi:hypothetical protein
MRTAKITGRKRRSNEMRSTLVAEFLWALPYQEGRLTYSFGLISGALRKEVAFSELTSRPQIRPAVVPFLKFDARVWLRKTTSW